MITRIPHFWTVVFFCMVAIAGYAVFSGWAVFNSDDAALRGDVIGTWKSFAVLAFGFWLGSSSGSKMRPDEPPATGKADDPVNTHEVKL